MKKIAITTICLLFTALVNAQEYDLRYDSSEVVGAGKCKECHLAEHISWTQSTHYKTFKNLQADDRAAEIADKMGGLFVTEDENCTQCHFTMKKKTPSAPPQAISGVSCELCHRPAKKWLDIHNKLAPFKVGYAKVAQKANPAPEEEPKDHKLARVAGAHQAGMKKLTSLYDFARSCFECHTVPKEDLVNVGGHKAGSPFEFVAWTQGEVRHNFLADEVKNVQRPRDHMQLMYIIGRAVDLEFGLLGLAEATKAGDYASSMTKRVMNARNELVKILNADEKMGKPKVTIPEVNEMVALVPRKFMHSSADKYTDLANRVQTLTKKMIENKDQYTAEIGNIDLLLPIRPDYVGEPVRDR